MRNKFTKSAQKALDNSLSVAKSFGHGYIGTEHLLIALVKTKGVAAEVMRENGVEEEKLRVLIEEMIETGEGVAVAERPQYTPRARKIIENSITEAERLGSAQAGTEHILIAMLKETECLGVRLLNTRGINVQKLYVDLLTATGQDVNSAKNEYMMQKSRRNKSATPMLDQYSRNLTEYAKDGKLDPIIGRDREITRLIEILSRRTKNNPCLVGEPGVGKTAVVEGLAQKIAAGDVPDIIKDKKVLTLDLSGMVAGSKYRGEFEERIKRAVREVTQSGNILLFIDEIHTIIGAGGAEGALDAANILKPSLARGELQLIGATTLDEYRKYIEKDAALERRFQPVDVSEPDTEETIAILAGLKERYEEHHGVKISDSAIVSAVKMSERYVNDRFLPDKAIDVIDEAGARVSLSRYLSTPELRELEEDILRWEKEKEDAIRNEDYAHAGELKKMQSDAEKRLEKLRTDIEKEKNRKEVCDTSAAKFQSEEAGNVDFVGTESEIISGIINLVSILPSNYEDEVLADCTDDLNRAATGFDSGLEDTKLALTAISDDGFVVETKSAYAPEMLTAFIKLNGATVGVVANRTKVYDDNMEVVAEYEPKLTANGCDKAAQFVYFCDDFSIPVLTLTNATGFKACKCQEKRGAKATARLTYAFASATVPKVNVIIGEAFGSAYVTMNSKSIGADMVFALPTAKVGMMDANAAAKIMYAKEIEEDASVLAEKTAEYAQLQGSVTKAASRGYVDNIVEPVDVRKYVIGALEMLYTKRQ